MDNSRTFTGLIKEIVRTSVKYLRHYIGEVTDNEDKLNKGRVLIQILELGWDSNDKGVWAVPRDKYSMIVPKVGDWVEVYFINGDPNIPVYLGMATEIKDMIPENYTGDVKESILFESPDNVQKIIYNEDDNLLSIGAGDESFVLGDSLDTFLNNVKTYLDAHVHSGVSSGGASSGPPASPSPTVSGLLSERIKGE